jgi:Fe-S cluster biogenesis protein NfuA
MPSDKAHQILDLCREVISPMVEADGGLLYIVSVQDDAVVIHLGGQCAGCPGAPITTRSIIEPAIKSVSPSAKVTVTAGYFVPSGARPAPEFTL